MRPVSIRWFDRLFFAAMALSMPFNVLEILQSLRADHVVYELTSFVAPIVINCFFWFFISRRASNIVKCIWTVFLAFEVFALPIMSKIVGGDFIGALFFHGALGAAVDIVGLLLSLAATVMLFRPDAAKWFAHRGKLVDVSASS
jgi:hypothetical protein